VLRIPVLFFSIKTPLHSLASEFRHVISARNYIEP
jgi:hypothetical protein